MAKKKKNNLLIAGFVTVIAGGIGIYYFLKKKNETSQYSNCSTRSFFLTQYPEFQLDIYNYGEIFNTPDNKKYVRKNKNPISNDLGEWVCELK